MTDDWLLRIGGTVSFWDHWVEDVIPSPGMAANNHEMLRLWRTIENIDRYEVGAIDSTYSLICVSSIAMPYLSAHFFRMPLCAA